MNEELSDWMGIDEIVKVLPHRYPLLMIDKVVNIRGTDSCVGIKNVTYNEPHFLGHFPNNPVMPGVLLIEAMAQTAGAMCGRSRGMDRPPRKVLFLTIDKAKFRRPVIPGDVVEFHMTKIAQRKLMWWYRGEAKVGGELAAQAEVGAMIAEE